MGAMAEHLKRSWIDRLRFRRLASRSAAEAQTADAGGDPLLLAGERLRQAREQRGLGLRQLAAETLVSTAVIEALERGWRDRLPEPAYLRTILPLLERYLALEPGSLAVALPGGHTPSGPGRQNQARLPLLSVQLFTTWQGTAAYGALMLALLYGLNLEQRRLAARGVHALNPVPPLSEVSRRQLPPGARHCCCRPTPSCAPWTWPANPVAWCWCAGSRARPGPLQNRGCSSSASPGPTASRSKARGCSAVSCRWRRDCWCCP